MFIVCLLVIECTKWNDCTVFWLWKPNTSDYQSIIYIPNVYRNLCESVAYKLCTEAIKTGIRKDCCLGLQRKNIYDIISDTTTLNKYKTDIFTGLGDSTMIKRNEFNFDIATVFANQITSNDVIVNNRIYYIFKMKSLYYVVNDSNWEKDVRICKSFGFTLLPLLVENMKINIREKQLGQHLINMVQRYIKAYNRKYDENQSVIRYGVDLFKQTESAPAKIISQQNPPLSPTAYPVAYPAAYPAAYPNNTPTTPSNNTPTTPSNNTPQGKNFLKDNMLSITIGGGITISLCVIIFIAMKKMNANP